MTTPIDAFSGKYRFLSNFWPTPVTYEGVQYPSTEHGYQAAKSFDPTIRAEIAADSSPGRAKKRGKSIALRDDWENVKLKVMEDLLRLKFIDAELREKLLATGDASLVEGNDWGDVFWGVCGGVGENHLGRLLMKVRAELISTKWSDYFDLVQKDAVDFLNGLQPGCIDLLITDPAYESLEKHRAKGTTTRLKISDGSSNVWFPIFKNERFAEFFVACYRALAKNAHLYMYCDDETAYVAKPLAEAAGFKYWKRLVWDKQKIGMGYHYRARCEYILFFEKGKRRLHNLGMPDVFDLKEDPEGYVIECARVSKGYPTEKPVAVSEKLILQSSELGMVVCDPFMGSASVGEAALKNGRCFIGADVADLSMRVAGERLTRLCEKRKELTAT